jgi:hypothetical protein
MAPSNLVPLSWGYVYQRKKRCPNEGESSWAVYAIYSLLNGLPTLFLLFSNSALGAGVGQRLRIIAVVRVWIEVTALKLLPNKLFIST